jgi:hypothetical protein
MDRDMEMPNMKTKKLEKIRLQRNPRSECTQEITSDNPDEICRSDGRRRKLLRME